MYAVRTPASIAWTLAATAAAITLASCSSETGSATPTGRTADSVVTIPTPGTTNSPSTADPAAASSAASGGFDVLANMPAAAKHHTNAGAQAFARYYIEAFGRLLMDPVKGQLTRLQLQCVGCKKLERIVDENVDAGRRWSGVYFKTLNVGEPDVDNVIVDASTVPSLHLIALCTNDPVVVHEPNGLATTRAKSSDVLAQLWMTWRDGQWLVTEFQDADYVPSRP